MICVGVKMSQIGKELIRKLKKEIHLKESLHEYSDFMNQNYKGFAYIRLALLYDTFFEVLAETEEAGNKLNSSYNEVLQEEIKRVINQQIEEKDQAVIENLRNDMIEDMKVLTAYVDKFQVYEHMLSRIQYQFEEVEEVDVDLLIQEMFTYIFADKDNVIINDKIRSLMYELPVRMTKTKFYEYIFDAIDIYNGTSIDGIDSFLYMVKSTAGLEGPADMKKKYPDIYEILEQFESVDYTTISKDEFEKLKELRNEILDELQERVNLLVQLQEIVNHVYVLILTKDYVLPDTKAFKAAGEIICKVNQAFLEQQTQIADLEPYFMELEGKQESIYEEIQVAEGMIYDLLTNSKEKLEEHNFLHTIECVQLVMNLLSDSIFMEFKKENTDFVVDADFLKKEKNKLVEEFAQMFENHGRAYNQSVMAMVLSKLPVIFNSQNEMKEYFEHTLSRCNNKNLLYACSKLIRDIMIASE